MLPSTIICGVLTFAWIAIESEAALIVVSILFGFFSGAAQALIPSVVVFLAPDLSKAGVRIGMSLFACGLGLLLGSPIAGAVLARQSRSLAIRRKGDQTYQGVLLFGRFTIMLGAICLAITRTIKVGSQLKVKA